jgi:uncharacterized protein with HEPN domain
MIDAAQTAIAFSANKTRADLETDKMYLYAVVHALQVIGEAAARISETTRTAYPDLAWKAIIGMRNRIVHDYLNIDHDIVWHVVSVELKEVVEKSSRILSEHPRLDA